jgi:hypothetical protein
MHTRKQTAVQLIQAQADDMIDRAYRHYRGPFRLGIPACVWRRAGLPTIAHVTTVEGHRARCIPIEGVEFHSYVEMTTVMDVVTEKIAKELEAMP